MFSTEHFIWIGICVVMILALTFAAKRFNWSFKTATYVMAGISAASELCKLFTHIHEVGKPIDKLMNEGDSFDAGGVLPAKSLPLHLCSILIFLFFYLAFGKNEETKEKLKSFVTPICFGGGFMAILLATSGVDFAEPYAYQCFIYHAGILWYGIYLTMTKQVDLSKKAYLRNLVYMGCLVIIMIWVNSILQVYDTNFFFVVRPPADNLPVLNLDHGWHVYFFHLVTVALLVLTGVHIGPMIKEAKRTREHKVKQ